MSAAKAHSEEMERVDSHANSVFYGKVTDETIERAYQSGRIVRRLPKGFIEKTFNESRKAGPYTVVITDKRERVGPLKKLRLEINHISLSTANLSREGCADETVFVVNSQGERLEKSGQCSMTMATGILLSRHCVERFFQRTGESNSSLIRDLQHMIPLALAVHSSAPTMRNEFDFIIHVPGGAFLGILEYVSCKDHVWIGNGKTVNYAPWIARKMAVGTKHRFTKSFFWEDLFPNPTMGWAVVNVRTFVSTDMLTDAQLDQRDRQEDWVRENAARLVAPVSKMLNFLDPEDEPVSAFPEDFPLQLFVSRVRENQEIFVRLPNGEVEMSSIAEMRAFHEAVKSNASK